MPTRSKFLRGWWTPWRHVRSAQVPSSGGPTKSTPMTWSRRRPQRFGPLPNPRTSETTSIRHCSTRYSQGRSIMVGHRSDARRDQTGRAAQVRRQDLGVAAARSTAQAHFAHAVPTATRSRSGVEVTVSPPASTLADIQWPSTMPPAASGSCRSTDVATPAQTATSRGCSIDPGGRSRGLTSVPSPTHSANRPNSRADSVEPVQPDRPAPNGPGRPPLELAARDPGG